MVAVPSAVIFVNNDLTIQVRNWIIKQLHINEYMDGYVFDRRVAADPDYVAKTVTALNRRILVIRSMRELENRSQADVVIFVKNALASVLHNNFGPPGQTHEVINLHWGQLSIF
jgi:hypothetical protein